MTHEEMEKLEREHQEDLNDEVRNILNWVKALGCFFWLALGAVSIAIGGALYLHTDGTVGDLLIVMGAVTLYAQHKKGVL